MSGRSSAWSSCTRNDASKIFRPVRAVRGRPYGDRRFAATIVSGTVPTPQEITHRDRRPQRSDRPSCASFLVACDHTAGWRPRPDEGTGCNVRDDRLPDRGSRRGDHTRPARAPQHHRPTHARGARRRRDRCDPRRGREVIILQGAGRSFCAGFNFANGFKEWDDVLTTDRKWDAGRDLIYVTSQALGGVPRFMSLWRSPKPVIAQVHG